MKVEYLFGLGNCQVNKGSVTDYRIQNTKGHEQSKKYKAKKEYLRLKL
jgi:hypothetical protein